MNLVRSSSKLFIANILNAAISFLGVTYLARELGPAVIGAYFLFEALLGLLSLPADLGLRGAVEKRISEGDLRGKYLSSVVILKIIPVVTIASLILILEQYINQYVGVDAAVLLAAALLIQEVAKLSLSVLQGELRPGETAIIRLIKQIVWISISIFLIDYGFGARGVIIGLIVGLLAMGIAGVYKISIRLDAPSPNEVRSLLKYSKFNAISTVGGYTYNWMDVAIMGIFLSQAEVGAYEVAWRISAVAILLSRAIGTTVFPQISEWSTGNETEEIRNLIENSIAPSVFLVIPAFFGVLVLSKDILSVVFGEGYTTASLVFIILMGDKVFQAVQILVGRGLQAIDEPRLAARATLISITTNLILNFIFIWKFGIVGAAVATLLSSLTNDVLHYKYFTRFINIDIPYKEITQCVLAATGMGMILFALRRHFAFHSIKSVITLVSIGVVSYLLLLSLFPNMRIRIKAFLTQV